MSMSATDITLPAWPIDAATPAAPPTAHGGRQMTLAYSEWLYVRDRYLVPAAILVAVEATGIVAFVTLAVACNWI